MADNKNVRSKRQRLEQSVASKSSWYCAYCGCSLEDLDRWEIDHVVPRSRGGGSELSNLLAACCECNAEKSNYSLEEFRILFSSYRKEYGPEFSRAQVLYLANAGIFLPFADPNPMFYFEAEELYAKHMAEGEHG